MKKAILFFAAILSFSASFAQVYVSGYTKSNGTIVEGYWRTSPNFTRDDNCGTRGNTNPYTGIEGTRSGGYNPSYFDYTPTTFPTNNNYNLTLPNNYYTIPSKLSW